MEFKKTRILNEAFDDEEIQRCRRVLLLLIDSYYSSQISMDKWIGIFRALDSSIE